MKSYREVVIDISIIYSSTDPRQELARRFVRRYVEERGVLARITESEQPVQSPILIINGHTLADQRMLPRDLKPSMYPTLADMERALDEHVWGV